MKIYSFNSTIYILSILIFLIGKTFNVSVKAAPLNSNVFDLLQTIDKEANVTANTNKLTFKLILNPVDESNKPLNFHLKLRSSLWITSDEFITLRNYLSDTDLSNALKIIRRKFFRRYVSKDLKSDNLRYKLLSALAFSSIQGQVHLLRNRLNDQQPEMLILVSEYHTRHKDPDDWKPLTSSSEDFQFFVENGPSQTPTTPGVSIGSEYDKSYYEKLIFNSTKLLRFGSGVPIPPSPTNQPQKPSSESVQQSPVPTEEPKPTVPNEESKEPGVDDKKDLIDFNSEVVPPPKPTETPPETPKENTSEVPKESDKREYTPSESGDSESVRKRRSRRRRQRKRYQPDGESEPQSAEATNDNVTNEDNSKQDDSDDESVSDVSVRSRKRKSHELTPENPSPDKDLSSIFKSPKYEPKPEENQAPPVDNNVVDKENPVPTEELKSNELPEADKEKANENVVSSENVTPTEPTGSTEEAKPVDTNEQVQPVNQTEEVKPVNPNEEVQPEKPNEEIQPVKTNEEVQPEKPSEEVQPTENSTPPPTEIVHPVESTEVTDANKPTEASVESQPVTPVQPEQQDQQKEQKEPTPKDNNVVDKDNPVPTEEVKANEGENPSPNKEAVPPEQPEPPTEPSEKLGTDTLSNVRKGDDSNLKTTFSIHSNDTENKPKFYQKSAQEEAPSETADSSESESESESEGNEPGAGKTKEQLLEDLKKKHPEYNETELMNKFEKVDTEDVDKDYKSPLTISLKINFLSSDQRISVPVITTAKLLLPKTIFTMCIREELTQQCAFELKDRLMARFEDNSAEAFKWGRLVSLLQTLAFQNDVFIEKYVMNDGGESVIEVAKPAFVLPMKTLHFVSQLVGKASSSDNLAYISFDLLPGPLNIPLGSIASDLGQNYGVHAQLSRFIEMYTDFEVSHSLFDLPNRKRVFKKGSSRRGRRGRSQGNKVYSMDELLSMNVDTKDLSNDIHFILSSYEKALFSVPKRLSGYKLIWETVDKYPELQRIWIEALTLMKLMDKKDNLRNFLANHTFKYQELKDLFEITYGIIAADNYDSVREFYETVGITQKDVDTNLARVKSLFFAKTGSNVTRLPPMLKPMHTNCLVKNVITSLTSNDLIERLQVMFVPWINEHKNSADGKNFDLAFLCAGSAVLLQHWHYFQLDQGFYDPPVPFITLITSFSRLAQGKYKNPGRQKEIKALVNSKAAKACRKYINAAGIVATSPYKTATINMTPKSLLGAIGNAIDVSMDSPPVEIAYAMKDYFKAELSKGKFGNSLGICMGLQLLHRLNTCLSVERSNDFSVYMHSLLTMDTKLILEKYTDIEANTKTTGKNHQFIKFACNPDNPTVHEAMAKLMPLVSTQSHLDLMDELVRREMLTPDLTPDGYLASNEETLNKDVVDLEDDTTTLLETFEDTNPRSLLEIADEVSYGDDDESEGKEEDAEESFIQQNYTHGGYAFDADVVGIPDLDSMDNLYRKLFAPMVNNFVPRSLNDKVLNQLFNPGNRGDGGYKRPAGSLDDDLALIMFDIRMQPSDDKDELVTLDVPFSFHENELELIESLESTALLRLLLYRIKKRIDSLEFDLKHERLKKQALELAKARKVDHISMPVHETVAMGNVDLNTYRGLLRVLESMPEDGFYFEDEGLVVPSERVGKLAAKRIHKSLYRNKKSKSGKKSSKNTIRDSHTPSLILQVIDPVDDTDINELTMPHEHVKKHDKLFYEKMTEL